MEEKRCSWEHVGRHLSISGSQRRLARRNEVFCQSRKRNGFSHIEELIDSGEKLAAGSVKNRQGVFGKLQGTRGGQNLETGLGKS